jgi:iron complex outermembrane recepter protein
MLGRIAFVLAAGASVLPMGGVAAAQDTPEEEIVVTAQRRSELLREVPQSVTAITDETLERLQADGFDDYVSRVPGMVATGDQPGNSRLVLRGLNNEGVGAAVGVYVDETPFGSSTGLVNGAALAADIDPFDIAQVEVLRGPQGTLYGANSLAGLIKFVTRDPSSDGYEFRVRTTGEMTEDGAESWAVRAAANIPLGDQAGLRISGFQRETGGFIDAFVDTNLNDAFDPGEPVAEDINPTEASGGRATFLLNATDSLSIRLSATTQDIDSRNDSTIQYLSPGPDYTVEGPRYGDLLRLGSDAIPSRYNTAYRIYNGTVNWDLGWASLISSTSYGELDQRNTQTQGDLRLDVDVLQDKLSQELRLASPNAPEGLEWQIGLFYTQEDGLIDQFADATTFANNNMALLQFLTGLTAAEILDQANDGRGQLISEYEEHAAFGEVTYHFTPQFDITAGARIAENEQVFNQIGTNSLISSLVVGIIPSGGPTIAEEDVTTWSLSARWRPSDETMFYARAATGFRPGGPNIVLPGSTVIPATYGSDSTTNYELGVKTDLFGGMLRLDAAIFHIDWEDIQLLVSELSSTTGEDFSGNANGDTAVSEGLEWAATLRPSDGLSVVWTGALTDAHLTADVVGAGIRALDGDTLPFTPEFSTSLDIDYEWTIFGDTTAYIGVGARYVGEQRSNFASSLTLGPPILPVETPLVSPESLRQLRLSSFATFDLRSGLEFDNNVTLELFVRNVGDERGPVRANPAGPDFPPADAAFTAGTVLRPRTVGVTLTAEF